MDDTNACGIVSMICGIVGLFLFGYILGAIACIFGFFGLVGDKPKKGLAVAGIALGFIDIILLLVMGVGL